MADTKFSAKTNAQVGQGSGGGMSFGSGDFAAMLGGVGNAINQYASIQDAKSYIDRLGQYTLNPDTGVSSLSSAKNAWLSYNPIKPVSNKDMGYNQLAQEASILGSVAQGINAGDGKAGIFNGIIGTLGMIASEKKATEQTNLVNKKIREINQYNQNVLSANIDRARDNTLNSAMMNATAYGGPLNMAGDGVMSPFGSRFAAGGPLHAYGSDWSNGLVFVNAGGSHEENPNEGVQMGIDPQGVPNLVEEGEVIYNDYVFSKRMKVPKKDKIKYKLGGLKLTYAEAAKKAQKESEERPNDPISKRGLEWIMAKLAESQETQREEKYMREVAKYAKQLGVSPEELLAMIEQQQAQEQQPQMQPMMQQPMMAAYGGELFTDGLDGVIYAKGGKIHINPKNRGKFNATKKRTGKTTEELTHSKNPLTRKRAIFAQNAKKWKHGLGGNLFWPGGSMDNYSIYGPWDNYIQDPTDPRFYNLGIWDPKLTPSYGTSEGITTQGTPTLSKRIVFPYENLTQHFAIPESTQKQVQANVKSNITKNNLGPGVVKGPDYDWMTGLRYLGPISNLTDFLVNSFRDVDYSRAKGIIDAYAAIPNVSASPNVEYAVYKPYSTRDAATRIGQQAASTRRAISNIGGGNRGASIAGVLMANNGMYNELGKAIMDADAQNYSRYLSVLDANNKTHQWLTQTDLAVQEANQKAQEARASGYVKGIDKMDYYDAAKAAALQNSYSAGIQGLTDIGTQQFIMNQVNDSNPFYKYRGSDGHIMYAGSDAWRESIAQKYLSRNDFEKFKKAKVGSQVYKDYMDKILSMMGTNTSYAANGGYLTIKRRKK